MKPTLIILLGVLFCSMRASASSINYTATFKEGDFSIKEENKYHVVENSKCDRYGVVGAPQVLITSYNFIIPHDKTIGSITINSVESNQFQGEYDLFPVQPDAYYMNCCDMPTPDWVNPDTLFYDSDAPYPRDTVVSGGVGYFDGANHIATISIFPIYYVASKKALCFFESIDFTINLTGCVDSSIRVQIRMHEDQQVYDDILSESVRNPQDISAWGYRPTLSDTALLRPGPNDPAVYPFVIITRDSLVGYWNSYVDWLNRKGKRAGVVTMEDVLRYGLADDPELSDHANLLRGYLKYAYQHGTVWVILGGFSEPKIHGDIYKDQVKDPVRYTIYDGVPEPNRNEVMCTPCPQGSLDGRCGFIAADIYYSDFTTDWEVNGNGLPGEIGDNNPPADLNGHIDRNEELLLGRVPVLDGQDVIRWTKKILNYEQNPGNGDFSYLIDSYWTLADGMNHEDQYGTYLLPSGFNIPIIKREEGADNPTGDYVIAGMSEYSGFINWHHHGNYCEAVLSYDANNWIASALSAHSQGGCLCRDGLQGCGMNNLTNTEKPGFLYACDCEQADISCAFERNNSFEKKSIGSCYILEDNGGVGFIGTSRHGWVGGSAIQKANFLRFIFNPIDSIDHHKIGPAKVYWSTFVNMDYLANQTILGSPEQLVWSAIPQHLTVIPDYVNARVRVLYQNTPVSGARVCCSSRDLTKYIVMESDNDGYATILPEYQFGDLDETVDITVTKHNYIPYQIIGAGQLADNLTWRGDLAFYGDVEVPIGSTLIIKPGSTIRILDGGLTVRGSLTIEDDSEYPVILTSANEAPEPGDWGRIFADEGSHLEIQYCFMEFAQDAILAINGSNVDLENCIIRNSLNSAITAIHPEVIQINNSEFQDNNHYAINVVSAVSTAEFNNNKIIGHHNI